jgi:hypothetical protein
MIQLVNNEGRTAVVLTCDVCQKPIRDAALAMVRWRREDDNAEDSVIRDLTFCHKGECDGAMPGDRRGDPWWELRHFLARLLAAAGTTPGKLKTAMYDVGALRPAPECLHEDVGPTDNPPEDFVCFGCHTVFESELDVQRAQKQARMENDGEVLQSDDD